MNVSLMEMDLARFELSASISFVRTCAVIIMYDKIHFRPLNTICMVTINLINM